MSLMLVRLSLCDFGAPGWEPWFPLSVVFLRLLTEFGMAVFVIPIPALIQGYHPSISY